MHANNGAPEAPGARAGLEAAAARAELRPMFPPEGPELVPGRSGVDGALGRVAAATFAAMLDGSWPRLKACPRDVCGWAFYDRSSNASATWCSMSVCGGRVKAGAYYRRRRAGGCAFPTLLCVSAVFVICSLAVYAAGLVLLAWEGRRDLAIALAAVGGVALSIATLP
jgi:hypothetical protein